MSFRRCTSLLLIIAVIMPDSLAQTTTPASSTSDYGGRTGQDGKPLEPYWRPEFHPVNNIQIGGCCKPAPTNTTATDDLLNMTRTILDLLQNQEPRQPARQPARQVSVTGRPRDCSEVQGGGVQISGVYPIYPDGPGNPFFVYCDMETDGGGWTVFQRRQDGSVDFYLYWVDYKYGFGSVSAEHWLGNDNIHRLSTQKAYELRVDLEDFERETAYARYSSFSIGDETSRYTMTIGNYSGNAGDGFVRHSAGNPFTTRDRDNDGLTYNNCASLYTGAWWYDTCHESNLNGQYFNGTTSEFAKGVVWYHWREHSYSLKKTEMKIRPV